MRPGFPVHKQFMGVIMNFLMTVLVMLMIRGTVFLRRKNRIEKEENSV